MEHLPYPIGFLLTSQFENKLINFRMYPPTFKSHGRPSLLTVTSVIIYTDVTISRDPQGSTVSIPDKLTPKSIKIPMAQALSRGVSIQSENT
jgi:hypothetical protein